MHSRKRHLTVFLNPNQELEEVVPLPTLDQVLYSRPNPDRSRKMCQNCINWFASGTNCAIHSEDVVADASAVCGHHVFGTPRMGSYVEAPRMQPVEPWTSGLKQTPNGVSCDCCRWFTPRASGSGACRATRDADVGATAVVEALGACARWVPVDGF